MKNLTDRITLLDLKGRESSLGASIFKMGLLLKYIKADSTHKGIPTTKILASKPESSLKAS